MDLWSLIVSLVPVGVTGAIGVAIYRFWRGHLVDIELHVGSTDTYCHVLDSERNSLREKQSYFAQVKVTVTLSAGASLAIDDVFFVLTSGGRYADVEFSEPHAPENVRRFFNPYGKEWHTKNAGGKIGAKDNLSAYSVLTAKGAARSHVPFPNLPQGGYRVALIIMLHRFSIVVPCELASKNGKERSTFCGPAIVCRKRGQQIDPVALARVSESRDPEFANLFRLKFAILDFDFLPGMTLFKTVPFKSERIPVEERSLKE